MGTKYVLGSDYNLRGSRLRAGKVIETFLTEADAETERSVKFEATSKALRKSRRPRSHRPKLEHWVISRAVTSAG